MTRAPARRAGIELLDRALAYTRGTLADVADHHLDRPTPCRGWPLGALLQHMDDALDAFTEGAVGSVRLRPNAPAAVRVAGLQQQACALLGAWSAAVPDVVDVGGLPVDVAVVAHAAALEITVHGWDVGRATGLGGDLPDDLAARLLPVAETFVVDADRPVRFARPLPTATASDPADRLLAFLGRPPDWSTPSRFDTSCGIRRTP